MNNFAIEIWYDEGARCTLYTVRWLIDEEADNLSETDKFFDKHTSSDQLYIEEGYQLFRLLTESISNKYGATDDFFDRTENRAQALPPKPKHKVEEIKEFGINFPLRLYCYRISESIVILFNGGIKSDATAQESKDLSMKLYEANSFAAKIEDALLSGIIEITTDKRYLQPFDKRTEIIL